MTTKYWAFKCKSCHKWSGIYSSKDLDELVCKCKYCLKSSVSKKKDKFGLNLELHGPYFDARVVVEKVKELNMKVD